MLTRRVTGYKPYGFDAVVKFGGSLLIDPMLTDSAIQALALCRDAGKRILVFPGGGPTDKAIEKVNERVTFAPATHHQACARALDQTGLMMCDPAFGDFLVPCADLKSARHASDSGKVPVLLPAGLLLALDPFEESWEITSDGYATWFAHLVGARLTMILTDVDGVHTPGRPYTMDSLLASVHPADLVAMGHTSVDRCVPEFLLATGGRAWVGHGGHRDRLSNALLGRTTPGTFIEPQGPSATER